MRILVALVLVLASSIAAAQYPERAVRIVVPYGVGTATEIMARRIADGLSKAWRQPVTVEALPGAGGIVGTQAIARGAPDGYTLGVVAGAHAAQPALGKVPYDPLKDFAPIMNMAFTTMVVVVPANSPFATAADLVAAAKARPRVLTFGSGGTGSSPHMSMEDFLAVAGIEMAHAPYTNLGQMATDLISGQLDASIAAVATYQQQIQAGKMKALGVTGTARYPLLPNVPPLGDVAPGYSSRVWIGIIAPAGLPNAIAQKVYSDANTILQTDEMRQALLGQGIEVDVQTGPVFWKQVEVDIERWARVAKRAGISGLR